MTRIEQKTKKNRLIKFNRDVQEKNRFLYEMRVEHPNTYYSPKELEPFAETGQLAAVLSCGVELGHIERYRKHYKLTAQGMMYAESQSWTEE